MILRALHAKVLFVCVSLSFSALFFFPPLFGTNYFNFWMGRLLTIQHAMNKDSLFKSHLLRINYGASTCLPLIGPSWWEDLAHSC